MHQSIVVSSICSGWAGRHQFIHMFSSYLCSTIKNASSKALIILHTNKGQVNLPGVSTCSVVAHCSTLKLCDGWYVSLTLLLVGSGESYLEVNKGSRREGYGEGQLCTSQHAVHPAWSGK